MQQRIAYYASEFIGTFVMMIIGISAIVLNFGTVFMQEWIPSPAVRLLLTGFLFAGGATLVVYSPVGRISGAHLNPAVSFAFFLERKITAVDFVLFSLMQVAGSIAAAYLALVLWSGNAWRVNDGMTLPGEGYQLETVFLTEVGITFLLVSTIFFFLHSRDLTKYTGIVAGLLVALLVFLTAPISGTSLNPARSIGPALAIGNVSYLWLYIAAPLTGSLIATTLHKMLPFLKRPLCAKLNHHPNDVHCRYGCSFVIKPNGRTENNTKRASAD
jgi:aquaporin Z